MWTIFYFLLKKKHQCYWELAQMRTEKSQSLQHLKQAIRANCKIQQHAKHKRREFASSLILQHFGGGGDFGLVRSPTYQSQNTKPYEKYEVPKLPSKVIQVIP
jgi:hypothetical protein